MSASWHSRQNKVAWGKVTFRKGIENLKGEGKKEGKGQTPKSWEEK